MAVNIQVNTIEDVMAILYFQDGSSMVVEENSTQSVQLVTGGICTVSEAPADEDLDGLAFAEKMVRFWLEMVDKIRQEAPTATPMAASTESKSPQRRDYKKKEGDDGYGDEPPQ